MNRRIVNCRLFYRNISLMILIRLYQKTRDLDEHYFSKIMSSPK